MAADLDSEFAATEQQLKVAGKALEDRLKRQQADDRSIIAKIIIVAFVALVAWVVIFATIGIYLYDWEVLVEPAKFFMTILGSVMLPVVTLVIGYYFGSKWPNRLRFLVDLIPRQRIDDALLLPIRSRATS